jgi:hypothetical protein
MLSTLCAVGSPKSSLQQGGSDRSILPQTESRSQGREKDYPTVPLIDFDHSIGMYKPQFLPITGSEIIEFSVMCLRKVECGKDGRGLLGIKTESALKTN